MEDTVTRPGSDYLIYTLEDGGDYEVLPDFSINDFRKLVVNGYFDAYHVGVMPPQYVRVYPAFAEHVSGIGNHDFAAEERRGLRVPPEVSERDIRRMGNED